MSAEESPQAPAGLFELEPQPPSQADGTQSPALGAPVPAASLPIARVVLETPVPHLDRTFDYLVTAELDRDAQPGVRVRVRFGGRRLNGYLVERVQHPEAGVKPIPLTSVVSAERVLAPTALALAHAVAERYAGTVADVLRAVVVPRVAKVEREGPGVPLTGPERPEPGLWTVEERGPEFLEELFEGAAPRAVLSVTPNGGDGWAQRLAIAAATTAAGGRGAIVVVPDARDVGRLSAALEPLVGESGFARLTADDGPTARYRSFLRVLRGEVKIVIGTRNAAFAPVRDLGLLAMWDDHDSSHVEPRAPYHHAREVFLLRATLEGSGALFSSAARSAEAQRLVLTGWARQLSAPRAVLRDAAPLVRASSDDFEAQRDPVLHAARLPRIAWEVAKKALLSGPVLVQVARKGFLPSLRCQDCREPARCTACTGPLALTSANGDPVCRWCGTYARGFTCPICSGHRLRASVVGADRTAEELGRAFPGVPVVRSTGADSVLSVPGSPALVISTPGVEPLAEGGYAAVLLLDADAQLAPEGLRVGEDTLHRWFSAASLARGRSEGGVVILTGHPSPQGQALVRWDPAGAAERELAERSQVRLPPAIRYATLEGAAAAADAFAEDMVDAAPVRRVGPTPGEDEGEHRWILFFDHAHGAKTTELLRRRKALGSLRRDPMVRVRVDDPQGL